MTNSLQTAVREPAVENPGWWKAFYDDSPFELYLQRSDTAELEASIAFLIAKLHLKVGDLIFDQCCGLGGMSLPLAERGYRLIGVDLCEKFIAMADAEAKRGNLPATFAAGDAFLFSPGTACDAAFNWYTSFGYAEADDQNIKMIERAFEALKPGGWFALDFLNMPMILQSFKQKMTAKLQSPAGEILQSRSCKLDLVRGTMDQHWSWDMPNGSVLEKNSTLRAYMPIDLSQLFQATGFVDVQLFGSISGEALTADSGRCIVLGRKPLTSNC